ncbi:MAG TPA: hypothetical protein VLK27_03755 [Chthoniobacterales bacterium]|nr:hypothetical protein [Chthoniobacterales bacterium]
MSRHSPARATVTVGSRANRRTGDELWVGNFADGKTNNYDPTTGASLGTINRADRTPLQFDGLWDMLPLGAGVYFTAGISDEEHGLFGLITED